MGLSGTAKTPAFNQVMKPLKELQTKLFKEHAQLYEDYEIKLQQYERARKTGKKSGEQDLIKPKEPDLKRLFVSDTTIEALAPILQANPRGILVWRDELAGWFGSFNKYSGSGSGSGGSDSANWLEMYNGGSLTVDRKTGKPKTIHVPQASVSITGGIQPEILKRALVTEHQESGLAARFLMACPPINPKKWTEETISPEVEDSYERLIRRLHTLEAKMNNEGDPTPNIAEFTPEAHSIWRSFFEEHNNEINPIEGDLRSALCKLEEMPLRLGLIIHLVKWAASDKGIEDQCKIDEETLRNAIQLTEWFKYEHARIYEMLSESEAEKQQRKVIDWLKPRGNMTTARELQLGMWSVSSAEEARSILNKLVESGLGQWEDPEPGKRRRSAKTFSLS